MSAFAARARQPGLPFRSPRSISHVHGHRDRRRPRPGRASSRAATRRPRRQRPRPHPQPRPRRAAAVAKRALEEARALEAPRGMLSRCECWGRSTTRAKAQAPLRRGADPPFVRCAGRACARTARPRCRAAPGRSARGRPKAASGGARSGSSIGRDGAAGPRPSRTGGHRRQAPTGAHLRPRRPNPQRRTGSPDGGRRDD